MIKHTFKLKVSRSWFNPLRFIFGPYYSKLINPSLFSIDYF